MFPPVGYESHCHCDLIVVALCVRFQCISTPLHTLSSLPFLLLSFFTPVFNILPPLFLLLSCCLLHFFAVFFLFPLHSYSPPPPSPPSLSFSSLPVLRCCCLPHFFASFPPLPLLLVSSPHSSSLIFFSSSSSCLPAFLFILILLCNASPSSLHPRGRRDSSFCEKGIENSPGGVSSKRRKETKSDAAATMRSITAPPPLECAASGRSEPVRVLCGVNGEGWSGRAEDPGSWAVVVWDWGSRGQQGE